MLRIEFDVAENTASEHLDDIARRARDMRPALNKILDLITEGERKQFATRGAFLGDTWEPLSARTLAAKARRGQPSTIMVASGKLLSSLTGGAGRRSRVSGTSLTFSTAVFYARFQQKRRQVVGMNRSQVDEAADLVRDYLITGRA